MKQPARAFYLVPVWALLVSSPSWSQQTVPDATQPPAAPSREVPRPDQLEPGVDTSATPPSNAASENPTPRETAAKGATPASEPKRTAKAGVQAQPPAASPGANTSEGKANAGSQPKTGAGKGQDRIELDTTQITGNRELPKVLYIVPWKRSDLGDLVGRPANSLLDEVLTPVDRDVFKRENRYYDALKPDVGTVPAGAAAPTSPGGAVPEGGGKP
jgi:hypothetical protein